MQHLDLFQFKIFELTNLNARFIYLILILELNKIAEQIKESKRNNVSNEQIQVQIQE